MIGFALLDDHIPLPKLLRDALGAYYVEGMTDPEPREAHTPDHIGSVVVPDRLSGDPDDYDLDFTNDVR